MGPDHSRRHDRDDSRQYAWELTTTLLIHRVFVWPRKHTLNNWGKTGKQGLATGLSSDGKIILRTAADYALFIFCHCFNRDAAIILLFLIFIFFLVITTRSKPLRKSFWRRKLSRINRFNLLLPVARRTFFFEIAVPSLAISRPFRLHRMIKFASAERFVDLKTSLNSVGFVSLCFLENLWCWSDTIGPRRPAFSCLWHDGLLKWAARPWFAYVYGIRVCGYVLNCLVEKCASLFQIVIFDLKKLKMILSRQSSCQITHKHIFNIGGVDKLI